MILVGKRNDRFDAYCRRQGKPEKGAGIPTEENGEKELANKERQYQVARDGLLKL